MIKDVGCGKEVWCPFLELVRLKQSRITNKQLKVSSAGGLKTRKRGKETPEAIEAELLLKKSLRVIVNKCAACGWAVVQMDFKWRNDTMVCCWWNFAGLLGRAKETIKRYAQLALYVALCTLCGPSEIFFDIRRVVQAFSKGEVDCISAGKARRISGFQSGARLVSVVEEVFSTRVGFGPRRIPRPTQPLKIGRWLGSKRKPMSQPRPGPFKMVQWWLNGQLMRPFTLVKKVYAAIFKDAEGRKHRLVREVHKVRHEEHV